MKRKDVRAKLETLGAKKPKVNPMADEYFASFAPMPTMKETPAMEETTTKVVPLPESIASVQGNETATTATEVPRLESVAAGVEGIDSNKSSV